MKTNMSKKKIATGRMRRLPADFYDMAEELYLYQINGIYNQKPS